MARKPRKPITLADWWSQGWDAPRLNDPLLNQGAANAIDLIQKFEQSQAALWVAEAEQMVEHRPDGVPRAVWSAVVVLRSDPSLQTLRLEQMLDSVNKQLKVSDRVPVSKRTLQSALAYERKTKP